MRSAAVAAVVVLVAVTLAGCANDKERYPTGTFTSSSGSGTHNGSSTTSRSSSSSTGSSTGSSTATGTGSPGANQPPVANLTADKTNGTAPLNVTFTLSASDPEGKPMSWSFLFGDGNKTEGTELPKTLVHQFTGGGNFTPTLTVSDGLANATVNITVKVAPGTAGFAPGLDPNCQRPDAIAIPPAPAPSVAYLDVRGTDSQWMYEESNDIPGLQISQEPGTNPVLGGPSDVDSLAVQFNCQNGDTLDF